MAALFVTNAACDGHRDGDVETRRRVQVIRAALRRRHRDKEVRGRLATVADLRRFHTAAYIRHLTDSRRVGRLCDVPRNEQSLLAARAAAGAVLTGVDAVMSGRCLRTFCVVRPPGHHASAARGEGFCLFNNVVVGARYARSHWKTDRVAVIDWDLHHGQGTESAASAHLFYGSLHTAHLYPCTGAATDTAWVYDAPVAVPFTTRGYRAKFVALLARVRRYRPQLVFISCGFDGHGDDPMAAMGLTDADFVWMTEAVCAAFPAVPVVSVLEGGYDVAVLGRCSVLHFDVLDRV
jgi:acetoin utilization deacetylase AcuC-like enzyme